MILNFMMKIDDHSPYYRFLYKHLQRIIREEASVGSTKVRFVSKGLRCRNDTQLRHVSLEFSDSKDTHVSEIYSNVAINPNDWKDEFTISLPNIDIPVYEIQDAEESLPTMYILGMHDCRHHVSDMLKLCYPLEKKL